MLTGSRAGAFGVVIGVLIEWDGVVGVRVAENIAAFATVMASIEVGEVAWTGGFVAHCGFRIGL